MFLQRYLLRRWLDDVSETKSRKGTETFITLN